MGEDEDNVEEGEEAPELKTVKELQKFAMEKPGIVDLLKEIEAEIDPINYMERYRIVAMEIAKLDHQGEVSWKQMNEERGFMEQEMKELSSSAPHLFAGVLQHYRNMLQAFIDYSAIMEITASLLWKYSAAFHNTYLQEHEVKIEASDILKKAMDRHTAALLTVARTTGLTDDYINTMVQTNLDKISADRKAAVDRENARVKEIEDMNIVFIRGHRDKKGEVLWSDLKREVGGHYTIDEWESITRKQLNLRIRKEKHASRWFRFVMEVAPTETGESTESAKTRK